MNEYVLDQASESNITLFTLNKAKSELFCLYISPLKYYYSGGYLILNVFNKFKYLKQILFIFHLCI